MSSTKAYTAGHRRSPCAICLATSHHGAVCVEAWQLCKHRKEQKCTVLCAYLTVPATVIRFTLPSGLCMLSVDPCNVKKSYEPVNNLQSMLV